MIWYFLIALAAAGIDRAVKAWASAVLQPMGSMEVLPGIFRLTYCENTGMAFSLLRDHTEILAVVSLLAVILMVVALIRRWLPRRAAMLSLALLIGGALGNLYDRVFLGYVVDLFDFYCIDYPIFNPADVCVNIGAYLLILDSLIDLWREEKAKKRKKLLEMVENADADEEHPDA